MTAAPIQRESIVGRRIVRVLQTSWAGPDQQAGPPNPHFCRILVELDSGLRVLLTDTDLGVPNGEDNSLIEADVFGDPDLSFLGEPIADLVVNQYEELYVVLGNGVYVQNLLMDEAGNCLWVGAVKELREDEDEEEPLALQEYWERKPVSLW